MLGILKESQLTQAVVAEILDKLKIKASLLEPKRQAFGDICDECKLNLIKDAEEAISDGVQSITNRLVEIGNTTKLKAAVGDNSEMFNQVASDCGWVKSV